MAKYTYALVAHGSWFEINGVKQPKGFSQYNAPAEYVCTEVKLAEVSEKRASDAGDRIQEIRISREIRERMAELGSNYRLVVVDVKAEIKMRAAQSDASIRQEYWWLYH